MATTLLDLIEVERPLSKFAALAWLELHAASERTVSASADTLADAWGWPRTNIQRFLQHLVRCDLIRLEVGHKSRPKSIEQKRGRLPTKIHLLWAPYGPSGGLKNDLDHGLTPPTGIRPLRGLVSPPEGEKNKTTLGLNTEQNYAYTGANLQVTHRQFEEMKKAYPELNVHGIIRSTDARYPRRQNKKLSPIEYLENVLDYRSQEIRGQAVDRLVPSAPTAAPEENDPRQWWQKEAVAHIKRGLWNGHLWGPLPWLEGSRCPSGTFSTPVLQSLKETWDRLMAKKAEEDDDDFTKGSIGRTRNNPSELSGGGPQVPVPALQRH